MFALKKDYKENEPLRASFNALAKRTFGLDFEDWYQNGYWRENYIPYSMVCDENVAANVSVNLTDMLMNGEVKRLIQLGTVMTDEAFRGQGLIRGLMEEIEKDYAACLHSEIRLPESGGIPVCEGCAERGNARRRCAEYSRRGRESAQGADACGSSAPHAGERAVEQAGGGD